MRILACEGDWHASALPVYELYVLLFLAEAHALLGEAIQDAEDGAQMRECSALCV